MRPDVALHTLRERRRGLIAWSAGLTLLVAILAAYWPTIRDSTDLQSFMRDLPEGLRAVVGEGDYTTPAGYLNGELFSFMAPLLLLVVAIGMGARAIPGEEDRGTADLLFSAPIGRTRILLEKVAAGLLVLTLLGAVLFATLALGAAAFDMDIAVGRLAAVSAATVLLTLPFAAVALAVGCATGARGVALGVASGLAVGAFLLETLGSIVDSLDGWRELSPWAWYASDDVLSAGLELTNVALLVGTAAALTAVAAVALQHRDLGV